MQKSVLGAAAATGVRLVISVDTGIRAVAEAAEARTLGLDLIVTDHHLPDDLAELPEALAVINPNQPGCPYPNKNLCGAAVAFKLAQALLGAAAAEAADPAAFRARTRNVLIPSSWLRSPPSPTRYRWWARIAPSPRWASRRWRILCSLDCAR